jgi:hypothetical protein
MKSFGAGGQGALRAGQPARDVHIRSNKPRGPALIQRSSRSTRPPSVERSFPPSIDLKKTALISRSPSFHTRSTSAFVSPSPRRWRRDVVVPLHLRYQACDDRLCFPPATAEARWTFRVVAPGAAVAPAAYRSVFDKIAFGTGEAPATAPVIASIPAASPTITDSGSGSLDRFTVLGTTVGYLSRDDAFRFASFY